MKHFLFLSFAVLTFTPVIAQDNVQWKFFNQMVKPRMVEKQEIPFTHKERNVNNLFEISREGQEEDVLFAQSFSNPSYVAAINEVKKRKWTQL